MAPPGAHGKGGVAHGPQVPYPPDVRRRPARQGRGGDEPLRLAVRGRENPRGRTLRPGRGGARGDAQTGDVLVGRTGVRRVGQRQAASLTFTPSMSMYVECESPDELERVFATLSEGGEVLMPLDDYGFG